MLPAKVKSLLKDFSDSLFKQRYKKFYWSQFGEDALLFSYFKMKWDKLGYTDGFYIEIGAFDPIDSSNSYKFYKLGWKGINIDPMPKAINRFNKFRPRDINLQIAIYDEEKVTEMYIWEQYPGINTLNMKIAEQRSNDKRYGPYNSKFTVNCKRLETIFGQYNLDKQHISFLSVDVEGAELNVLKSNNWNKYRPEIIILESFEMNIANYLKDAVHIFLEQNNYKLLNWFYGGVMYIDNDEFKKIW